MNSRNSDGRADDAGGVNPLDMRLCDLVGSCLENECFAGAAIRVEGEAFGVYERAWGYALRTEREKIVMGTHHRFDIASLSKVFTTTAILRLITLGRMRLESNAAELLDLHPMGLPRVADALEKATILKLLTHSTGLHYWYPFYTSGKKSFFEILDEVITKYPIENKVIYSDINFMILGKIIEKVTGLTLETAMRDLVFDPLELVDTGYRATLRGWPAASASALAAVEKDSRSIVATEFGNRIEMGMVADLGLRFDGWRDPDTPLVGEADDGNCFYYFGGAAGHAGVFSTVADVCKLGSLYLRDGSSVDASANDQYLKSELVEEAVSNHGDDRGLGFQLGALYPRGGFGHTGFTGAYLYCDRKRGIVVAALTNRLHVAKPKKILDFYKAVTEVVQS